MILVDVNVVLDVFQRREPHFAASASVIDRVAYGRLPACVAAHGVTTLYFLVQQSADRRKAREAIDWIRGIFEVATVDQAAIDRARALDWPDFEDAVVAAAAEAAGCKAIVTRNTRDFRGSPVPAVAPEELVIDEIHESFVAGYRARTED